jgi:molecular chaperone DnaK
VPQIDVTFSIDANGIVSVSAQDKLTGLEQATQITPSSGLAPEEIDRLISEAEHSIERDKEMRDIIMQRNRLDSLITNARRALVEFGKNLSPDDQQNIKGVLTDAEAALESNDMAEVYAELVRVEQAASKITESMMSTVS